VIRSILVKTADPVVLSEAANVLADNRLTLSSSLGPGFHESGALSHAGDKELQSATAA